MSREELSCLNKWTQGFDIALACVADGEQDKEGQTTERVDGVLHKMLARTRRVCRTSSFSCSEWKTGPASGPLAQSMFSSSMKSSAKTTVSNSKPCKKSHVVARNNLSWSRLRAHSARASGIPLLWV